MSRKFRGVVLPFPTPTVQAPPLSHAKAPDEVEGTAYLDYLLELADEFYRISETPAEDKVA